ncbi:hypothetical protein L345_18264, partial [Ophiophagus hannah]
ERKKGGREEGKKERKKERREEGKEKERKRRKEGKKEQKEGRKEGKKERRGRGRKERKKGGRKGRRKKEKEGRKERKKEQKEGRKEGKKERKKEKKTCSINQNRTGRDPGGLLVQPPAQAGDLRPFQTSDCPVMERPQLLVASCSTVSIHYSLAGLRVLWKISGPLPLLWGSPSNPGRLLLCPPVVLPFMKLDLPNSCTPFFEMQPLADSGGGCVSRCPGGIS